MDGPVPDLIMDKHTKDFYITAGTSYVLRWTLTL